MSFESSQYYNLISNVSDAFYFGVFFFPLTLITHVHKHDRPVYSPITL